MGLTTLDLLAFRPLFSRKAYGFTILDFSGGEIVFFVTLDKFGGLTEEIIEDIVDEGVWRVAILSRFGVP